MFVLLMKRERERGKFNKPLLLNTPAVDCLLFFVVDCPRERVIKKRNAKR